VLAAQGNTVCLTQMPAQAAFTAGLADNNKDSNDSNKLSSSKNDRKLNKLPTQLAEI